MPDIADDSVPAGEQRRPWRRHAAFVAARVWVEPRSGGRVQIALGPHRYSAAPAGAVDLARQLLAAAEELDRLKAERAERVAPNDDRP